MHSEDRVFGVIFPLPQYLIMRIMRDKRNVFAKFTGRTTKSTRIGPGSLILFYQSQSDRSIVGEAVVRSVNFMQKKEAISRYGDRFFLSSTELETYSKRRPAREDKPLLIIDLDSPKLYKNPMKSPFVVTMVGRTLTQRQYSEITHQTATAQPSSQA